MGPLWCPKQAPSVADSGGAGPIAAQESCLRRGLRRLMRRLKKQCKLLKTAIRPPTFHCQYDPLSYSRNFDSGSSDRPFLSRLVVVAVVVAVAPPPSGGRTTIQ
ncbi:hypothetical protein QJS04_geneDACA014904 [Acorus gramineus]|uniref:Uncharacterized protein n=1 Tax=Acorus gramineus TaxID=55184 RepID=A0AAV9BSD6_ACOGR|nr:hypothetical protein QJS04_geneDACA014904 [Acorus gramineus]